MIADLLEPANAQSAIECNAPAGRVRRNPAARGRSGCREGCAPRSCAASLVFDPPLAAGRRVAPRARGFPASARAALPGALLGWLRRRTELTLGSLGAGGQPQAIKGVRGAHVVPEAFPAQRLADGATQVGKGAAAERAPCVADAFVAGAGHRRILCADPVGVPALFVAGASALAELLPGPEWAGQAVVVDEVHAQAEHGAG